MQYSQAVHANLLDPSLPQQNKTCCRFLASLPESLMLCCVEVTMSPPPDHWCNTMRYLTLEKTSSRDPLLPYCPVWAEMRSTNKMREREQGGRRKWKATKTFSCLLPCVASCHIPATWESTMATFYVTGVTKNNRMRKYNSASLFLPLCWLFSSLLATKGYPYYYGCLLHTNQIKIPTDFSKDIFWP